MKRSLEHNLLICVLGVFSFWIGQIAYTILLKGCGFQCDSVYYIGQAVSYILLCYGLFYISKGSKILRNCFVMFFFLAIANLGDEISFRALDFDHKELWYAAAIVGYFVTKIYKIKK